jgi:D-hexose-6-phosphate mutarotase
VEEREHLTVAEETDRIYHGWPAHARVLLHDGAAGRTIAIDNDGFPDAGTHLVAIHHGPRRT